MFYNFAGFNTILYTDMIMVKNNKKTVLCVVGQDDTKVII